MRVTAVKNGRTLSLDENHLPEYAFEYQFHIGNLVQKNREKNGGEPGFQPCSYDTAAGTHRIDPDPGGVLTLR